MQTIIKIICVVVSGIITFAVLDFIIQKFINWYMEKTTKKDNVKEGKK